MPEWLTGQIRTIVLSVGLCPRRFESCSCRAVERQFVHLFCLFCCLQSRYFFVSNGWARGSLNEVHHRGSIVKTISCDAEVSMKCICSFAPVMSCFSREPKPRSRVPWYSTPDRIATSISATPVHSTDTYCSTSLLHNRQCVAPTTSTSRH